MVFYISEETKAELEAKIKDLEKANPIDEFESNCNFGRKQELKDVLSKCIMMSVLPENKDVKGITIKQ